MKKALAVFVLLTLTTMFADNPHNVPRGPIIVADVNLLAQTLVFGVPSTFTAYTVPASGLYRVSAYVDDGILNSNQQWLVASLWTDDSGTARLNELGTNVGGYAANTWTVFAVAGSTIQIRVDGNTNGAQFNLYATVEQL